MLSILSIRQNTFQACAYRSTLFRSSAHSSARK